MDNISKHKERVSENRRAWVEIDLSALEHNISEIRSVVCHDGKQWMLMVKGNAYGHGLVEVSKLAEKLGTEFLGVSYFEEARELRDAGLKTPILMFTEPDKPDFNYLKDNTIVPVVSSLVFLEKVVAWGASSQEPLSIHVKIDTGLGRFGFNSESVNQIIPILKRMRGISVDGLLTHYSAGNANHNKMREQLASFMTIVSRLNSEADIKPKYIHASNSAAAIWLEEGQTNLVRLGLAAYGLEPSVEKKFPVPLRQGFQWKAKVVSARVCKKAEAVGYGGDWVAQRDSRIGVISIGYADGMRRAPSELREILCRGMRVPLISKPMMSHSLVDLTELPDIVAGEEVVLIGHQGRERITFEEVADALGTINEEVVVAVPSSVPRMYHLSGSVV